MITLFHRHILVFIFIIEMNVTSKVLKQNRLAHHQYLHQIFPVKNSSELYTVYVAGKEFTIKVPASVEDNQYKIMNWKVINSNPKRLMFISGPEAFIMIDEQIIRKLIYPNVDIGSIIVLGNNEALHMPTISNPDTTRSPIDWNYLELLYFNEEEEKIKISEKIPWFDQNDWYFIREWKLLDYIIIETKMYILSKRRLTIYSEGPGQFANEFSIIRLSLDVDTSLLSTAVELHKRVLSSFSAQFLVHLGSIVDENKRYSIIIQETGPVRSASLRCFIPKMEARFKAIGLSCEEVGVCNQLHQHLRSVSIQSKKCGDKPTVDCPFPENLYLTDSIDVALTALREIPVYSLVRTFHTPYPHEFYNVIYSDIDNRLFFCKFQPTSSLICTLGPSHLKIRDFNTDLVLNVINGSTSYVFPVYPLKPSPNVLNYPCDKLGNCFDCIMYGFSLGCIWVDGYFCEQRSVSLVYSQRGFIYNYCKKIVSFSVKHLESKKILEIEFQEVFEPVNRFHQIAILAGPNNDCVDIKMNNTNLTCELNSRTSGYFIVNVTFYNDSYLGITPIIAISNDYISIEATSAWKRMTIIATIVVVVIIIVFCSLFVRSFPKVGEATRTFRSKLSDFIGSSIEAELKSLRSKPAARIAIRPKKLTLKTKK
uniref:Sema domain-containing protein n=1 Tax=Tetranychus urticae TaxID=32264 RepID=T1KDY8_TETUR